MASKNIKDEISIATTVAGFPEITAVLHLLPSRWLIIRSKTKEITIEQAKQIIEPVLTTYKEQLTKYLKPGYELVSWYPVQNKGGQWRVWLNLHKDKKYIEHIISIWYGANENKMMFSLGDFPDAKTNKGMQDNPVELMQVYNKLKSLDAVKDITIKEEKEKIKEEQTTFDLKKSLNFLNTNTLIVLGIISILLIFVFKK